MDTGGWTGCKINKTSSGYIVDDTKQYSFLYDKANGTIPQVGGIYDASRWISVEKMYEGLFGVSSMECYLCSYVNRNYLSRNTIVVSGMPTDAFVGATYVNEDTWETADLPEDVAARDPNGTYTLQNPTEEIYNWYWQSENGCVITRWNMASGQPIIYPGNDYKNTSKYLYVSIDVGDIPSYPAPDDYSSYVWTYSDGSADTVVDGGSVKYPQPAEVEKYWNGYKLEQGADGKYTFASEITKLTYGDYMPVNGRIYDAAATLEIANVNYSDDTLYSSPRDMTADSDGTWQISASSIYSTNSAFKAFDGNMGSAAWINSGSPWYIQWQNKDRKTLVKYLKIYLYDTYCLNKESFFQGSNDGAEWFDIIPQGNFGDNNSSYENGVNVITLNIPDNGTPYYYHRLGSNYNSGSYSIIYEIQAKAQADREVPK
jgi:hypothetical protein